VSPTTDREFMARALQLARRGLMTADPNPRVGCVLARAGRIVGEGWHERAGGPHAEVVALRAAADAAVGATAYVTLEPCNHVGRTGPCTRALIEAGVARVVCATTDPNPHVTGGGLRVLQEAGIAVELGLLGPAATALNAGFESRFRRGRPWLRSKLAASLDGRTALASGASQWITDAPARHDVHRWRARSSAILTGIDTVLADDPLLTVRLPEPHALFEPPWRVVLDSSLRLPPDARLFSGAGRILVCALAEAAPSRREALERAGARVEIVPGQGHCDLAAVMSRLATLEINEVWVEAGARLNGALLEAGLVDELVVYLAPQLLGNDGRGMFALPPLGALADRIELEFVELRRVGRDLRIVARPTTVADRDSAG
jgi:diaminohydroxyphosphoribosylaminopyrimidine deaminase/5-amino-6-(5-phosphoribosylamino)uracil reductase